MQTIDNHEKLLYICKKENILFVVKVINFLKVTRMPSREACRNMKTDGPSGSALTNKADNCITI